jgi:hypothetical protein
VDGSVAGVTELDGNEGEETVLAVVVVVIVNVYEIPFVNPVTVTLVAGNETIAVIAPGDDVAVNDAIVAPLEDGGVNEILTC